PIIARRAVTSTAEVREARSGITTPHTYATESPTPMDVRCPAGAGTSDPGARTCRPRAAARDGNRQGRSACRENRSHLLRTDDRRDQLLVRRRPVRGVDS